MGSEIPEYDEDLEEAFIGPYNAEDLDESWDDAYEEEAARLFQYDATSASAEVLASSLGAGSGETQRQW